jgi:hypothetical protein
MFLPSKKIAEIYVEDALYRCTGRILNTIFVQTLLLINRKV